MGLLIDGQVNTIQELRTYENGILDVASMERIDLTGKMGLAQNEIGTAILHFLLRQAARDPKSASFVFSGESPRRRLGVSDVVLTQELKRWHALASLELACADAYNNQLNDRYAAKRKEYEQLSASARLSFFETGVGIALDPIVKPSHPQLSFVAGVGTAATFYVRTTWVNHTGQESSASEPASFTTTNGTQLSVMPADAPGNAAGWNVYAGYAADDLTLQNDAHIDLGNQWVVPPTGLKRGRAAGSGQTADRYVVNDRALLRG